MKKQPLITVVGSSNFDIIFKTKKNPAVGESVLATELETDFGGKGGTQAVTASRLGGNVNFLTCVGDDVFGRLVFKNLKDKGINLDLVNIIKDTKNGMAAGSFDEEGENIVICYPGANSCLTPELIEKNLKRILESKIILTQFETPIESVIALADKKEPGNILALNPSPVIEDFDYSRFIDKIDLLIPNEVEVSQISGIKVKDFGDIIKASDKLLDMGVKDLVVTLGKKGVLVKNKDTEEHIPAEKVKVLNTHGAGDIFAGSLVYKLAITDDIVLSAIFANRAAAVSVTRIGTQGSIPTLQEIEDFERSSLTEKDRST